MKKIFYWLCAITSCLIVGGIGSACAVATGDGTESIESNTESSNTDFEDTVTDSNNSDTNENAGLDEEYYIFEFDRELDGYVVMGVSDAFESNVIEIPECYDGEFGEKPVVAIQSQAFFNKDQIIKAVFPKTVKSIRIGEYTGNNRGRIFNGCTSLETVVMTGMEVLDGVLNFYNCVNLKEIIVGEHFVAKDSQFFVSNSIENYQPKLDVFIESNTQSADFDCRRDENSATNLMLTGNYYYYDENSACNTWKYDTDGTPLILMKHEYNARGECVECAAIDPKGINYFYYEDSDVYVVDGLSNSFKGTEVLVTDYFDDGINGYKVVKGISSSAFRGYTQLTKIILPTTLTEIVGKDGRLFERCHSLEYVSMVGIKGFTAGQGNSFLDCINLKTLIVNGDFRNDVQSFFVRPTHHKDYMPQVDVYISEGRKGANFSAKNTEYIQNNMFSGKVYLYKEKQPSGQESLNADWWHWVEGKPTAW